jgi:tetratricopeptide (TPR) repeat protein
MPKRDLAPVLSVKHLLRVLDAIRSSRKLPPTPLLHFQIVQNLLLDPSIVNEPAASNVVVAEWLVGELLDGLAKQRQHYNLAPPALADLRDTVLVQFADDFRQDAGELEAWSILYHRFARADLDFDWEELADVALQNKRTLRRRQDHGAQRLLHTLITHEQAERLTHRKQVLRRQLPPLPGDALFGRQAILNNAYAALTGDGPRWHIALCGPGGIGKTTLATVLTHQLLDDIEELHTVWIKASPGETADDLLARCLEALASQAGDESALRAFCQMYDTLIVIDEIEHVLAGYDVWENTLDPLLDQLVDARLILTSRFAINHPQMTVFGLPELDYADSTAYMVRLWEENSQPDSARLDAVWRFAGGNPLGIAIATRLIAHQPRMLLEDENASLQGFPHDRLYEMAWRQLSPDAQVFWMALWLQPPDHIDHEMACFVSQLSGEVGASAAQQLSRLLLVTVSGLDQQYGLHSIARQFLRNKVNSGAFDPDRLSEAVERLSSTVLGSPTAGEIVFHLLKLAPVLSISFAACIRLVDSAWTQITRQGAWAQWRPVMEKLFSQSCDINDLRAMALTAYWTGIIYRWLGVYQQASEYFEQALHVADQRGTFDVYARALIEKTVVDRYQGRIQSAQMTAQVALDAFQRLEDGQGIERCLMELAQLALDRGQPTEALSQVEELTASARGAAITCNAHLMLGNLKTAQRHARQAIALASDDMSNQARARAITGQVYLAMGRLHEAEDHLILAISLLDQSGDVLARARAASSLGHVYQIQERLEEALTLLEDTAAAQRSLRDDQGLYTTLETLVVVYSALVEMALQHGETDAARAMAVTLQQLDTELQSLLARLEQKRMG